MRRARRCPGWVAATAFASLAAACSGSGPGAGADGGVGDGSLPGFDGPPPTGTFPLGVSADGGSLVTADGRPFLLHAEAAWSLIAQPTTAGAMQYLADRHGRGVQVVLVNLIEHLYADHAPADAAGDAPFTTAGDFSTPSEAYFAHADQVIDLAASQGIAVLLVPAYLGFEGGNEGWFDEMSRLTAAQCRSYGDFVGQRYAARHNIIWVWGGDYTPPTNSQGETCLKSIRDGILAAEPGVLATAHWEPESTSRDEPAFAGSINLVGVYTYDLDLQTCLAARTLAPHMPAFLIETCYEGETIRSCPNTPADIRRRQWWAFLGCGAGEVVGNNPIWKFGTGWPQQLASPASIGEQRLAAIAGQVAWQTLAPTPALVTGGQAPAGNDAELAITRTADHKQALIYIPPAGASTITVDLTQMAGAVTATWQDPSDDHSVTAGDGLTGSHAFKTPGNGSNDGGDRDWVLVLTVP